MSWMDWILRPVFSRDLRTVRRGNHVWDIVDIVERYAQEASQAPTNRDLLDRNAITGAALERVENGGDFAYPGRARLLELIEATPHHEKVLDILAKDVREREDLDSALLLGALVEEDDFNKGVLQGVQSNLFLRCAQLIFAFRHRNNQSVENVLSALTCELDRREGVNTDLSNAIRNTIVLSKRFEQLDPTVVFCTLCALRIPSAAKDAAEMFFRSPEALSGAVLRRIAMSDWVSGGAAPAVLREMINPERLMAKIRDGDEGILRKAFLILQQEEDGFAPARQQQRIGGRLLRIFNDCVAEVSEEANSFGSHDVQIFPSWDLG